MAEVERVWLHRLRWRTRGALLGPALLLGIPVQAALLHWLPFWGEGTPLAGALLLAAFIDLALLAVIAPIAGRQVRRLRGGLPPVIARDTAGAAVVVAVTLALVAAGLSHQPAVREEQDDFARQSAAAVAFLSRSAPPAYRANADRADTFQPGPDLFRTCAPGPDPARAWCVFVNTAVDPPRVRPDLDRTPNARYFR